MGIPSSGNLVLAYAKEIYIILILANSILRKAQIACIVSFVEVSYFLKRAEERYNAFWKDRGLRNETIVLVIKRNFIDVLLSFVGIMRV